LRHFSSNDSPFALLLGVALEGVDDPMSANTIIAFLLPTMQSAVLKRSIVVAILTRCRDSREDYTEVIERG
jgi:hypothetical protein